MLSFRLPSQMDLAPTVAVAGPFLCLDARFDRCGSWIVPCGSDSPCRTDEAFRPAHRRRSDAEAAQGVEMSVEEDRDRSAIPRPDMDGDARHPGHIEKDRYRPVPAPEILTFTARITQ